MRKCLGMIIFYGNLARRWGIILRTKALHKLCLLDHFIQNFIKHFNLFEKQQQQQQNQSLNGIKDKHTGDHDMGLIHWGPWMSWIVPHLHFALLCSVPFIISITVCPYLLVSFSSGAQYSANQKSSQCCRYGLEPPVTWRETIHWFIILVCIRLSLSLCSVIVSWRWAVIYELCCWSEGLQTSHEREFPPESWDHSLW